MMQHRLTSTYLPAIAALMLLIGASLHADGAECTAIGKIEVESWSVDGSSNTGYPGQYYANDTICSPANERYFVSQSVGSSVSSAEIIARPIPIFRSGISETDATAHSTVLISVKYEVSVFGQPNSIIPINFQGLLNAFASQDAVVDSALSSATSHRLIIFDSRSHPREASSLMLETAVNSRSNLVRRTGEPDTFQQENTGYLRVTAQKPNPTGRSYLEMVTDRGDADSRSPDDFEGGHTSIDTLLFGDSGLNALQGFDGLFRGEIDVFTDSEGVGQISIDYNLESRAVANGFVRSFLDPYFEVDSKYLASNPNTYLIAGSGFGNSQAQVPEPSPLSMLSFWLLMVVATRTAISRRRNGPSKVFAGS